MNASNIDEKLRNCTKSVPQCNYWNVVNIIFFSMLKIDVWCTETTFHFSNFASMDCIFGVLSWLAWFLMPTHDECVSHWLNMNIVCNAVWVHAFTSKPMGYLNECHSLCIADWSEMRLHYGVSELESMCLWLSVFMLIPMQPQLSHTYTYMRNINLCNVLILINFCWRCRKVTWMNRVYGNLHAA